MDQSPASENRLLVQWEYSYDEWRRFQKWKSRKKGMFHYFSNLFRSGSRVKSHYISVNTGSVSIDGMIEPFAGRDLELRTVNISEIRNMNVMEIRVHHQQHGAREISFPIPRGRLKEAVGLEERLNQMRTNQPGLRQ